MSDNKLEEKMTDAEMAKREKTVKSMKKNLGDFRKRYGDRAKEVMYATATKQAMKEESEMAKQDAAQKKREQEKAAEQSKAAEKRAMDWAKSTKNEAYQIGDTVKPTMGPHKGEPHEVLHVHADGSVNIRPRNIHPDKVEYRVGMAKARPEHLEGGMHEEVEAIDEISTDLANRYLAKTKPEYHTPKENEKRAAGRSTALKKKWGGRVGGTEAPKVPTTEEVEAIDEISTDLANRYLAKTKPEYHTPKENEKRASGRATALKKKWGGRVGGTEAPKVPTKDNPEVEVTDADDKKKTVKEATAAARKGISLERSEEMPADDSQLDEMGSLDQLHSRSKFSFNKTAAGKKSEQDRNKEKLKQQIKSTKSMGGIAGPKGKLPEELEVAEELKGSQHKIDANKNKKIDAHDFKLLRSKAKKVEENHKEKFYVLSDVYGTGLIKVDEHAEPDADGIVDWYVVEFDHGQEKIFVEDLELMAAQYEALNKGE